MTLTISAPASIQAIVAAANSQPKAQKHSHTARNGSRVVIRP
jgi:hypothetical protein